MRDESGADELAHHEGQVGRNGRHSQLKREEVPGKGLAEVEVVSVIGPDRVVGVVGGNKVSLQDLCLYRTAHGYAWHWFQVELMSLAAKAPIWTASRCQQLPLGPDSTRNSFLMLHNEREVSSTIALDQAFPCLAPQNVHKKNGSTAVCSLCHKMLVVHMSHRMLLKGSGSPSTHTS